MKDFQLIKVFIKYAKPYKYNYIFSFLLMPITAYAAVKCPDYISKAIDNGIKKGDYDYLIHASFLFALFSIIRFVAGVFQNLLLQSGGISTLKNLREKLVKHICHLSTEEYEKKPVGVFVSRASSDIENIGETFLQGISYIISDCLIIIAVFIFIFQNNVTLALLTLGLIPLIILMVNYFRIKLRSLYDKIRGLNGQLSAQLNEAFLMLFSIRNFHLQDKMQQTFSQKSTEYRDKSIKSINLDAFIYSFIDGLLYITIGLIFLYIAYSNNLNLSVGFFVAYIILLQQLFDPIKELSGRLAVLQSAFASLDKINQIFMLQSVKNKGEKSIANYNINIKNLSFAYKKDNPIIKDISLQIKNKTSLAIVGPTGSGKSTLTKLLTRQYDIDGIYLGDTALKNINRDYLKQIITLVPQDPAIFQESIYFNIGLNRENINLEKIIEISKKVMLHSFVESLPDKYDTILQESGSNLSTGQRQLIALARALASPAKIIIFDEATANIDSDSEIMIQQALQAIMQEKTTILIAHRLSTIRKADNIIVLDQGKIAEEGTNEELLLNKKLYYYMSETEECTI